VGGDALGRQEVVAREAVLAGEIAGAAAEGQPRDPGGADDAAGRGEPVAVGCFVEHGPRAAAAGPGRPGVGVDDDRLQRAEVDDDAAVVRAEPGSAVAATAHRQVQPFVAGHADRGSDVGRPRAPHDRSRTLVDHAVVDLAGVVVTGASRRDHLAAYATPQPVDRSTRHACPPCHRRPAAPVGTPLVRYATSTTNTPPRPTPTARTCPLAP